MISLEHCSDRLENAPNSVTLLQAWRRWRRDDAVPLVNDVIVEDLRSALSGISVLEVHSPDRIIFRLFGTLHADISGRDLKGENLLDHTPPNERESRSARIWNLASVPCGSVYTLSLIRSNGLQMPIRGVVLPVAPSKTDDPMRMYAAIDIVGDTGTPDGSTVDLVPALDEQAYVDIGYGAPE